MTSGRSLLTGRDHDVVLEAVRVVGDVEHPAELAPVIADQLAMVVHSDVISVNDVDPDARILNFVMRPESFSYPESAHRALEELMAEHPLIRHARLTGDGSARKISDFWTEREWHSSALYHRVYAPMGVEHQMSLALPTPRPAVLGIALNRQHQDFSERDRAALNTIRPHLSQAWRRSREYAHLKTLFDAAATALHQSRSGVVLLADPVQELTPGSLTELYRFFGRPPARSALPGRVEQWVRRERLKSESVEVGSLGKPLVTTREGSRLALHYLPPRPAHPAAILVRRIDQEDVSARMMLLGLSPRETQVLQLLTDGSTNAEIAARLHLAPSTVKKHLDHVYAKLGVTGRVQAVAVALSTASGATRPSGGRADG